MNIPDHVSIDPESPFYFPQFQTLGVRFKGIERRNDVVEFCVSEGWVRVHVTGARGRVKRERGKWMTVKLSGPVEPFVRQPVTV